MFTKAEHAQDSHHADDAKTVEGVKVLARHCEDQEVGNHGQNIDPCHFARQECFPVGCCQAAEGEFRNEKGVEDQFEDCPGIHF